MSVNGRAKLAIETAGLNIDGYLQDRVRAGTPDMHLVDWRNLTCNLLESLRERHSDSVTFHWGSGLRSAADISLQEKTVQISQADTSGSGGSGASAPVALEYDLLIGADGANSLVRDALMTDGHLQSKVMRTCTYPSTMYLTPSAHSRDRRPL